MALDEDGRCALTGLRPEECACKEHRNSRALDLSQLRFTARTAARRDGVCGLNEDHLIVVGDTIARVEDSGPRGQVVEATWACSRCIREAAEQAKPQAGWQSRPMEDTFGVGLGFSS